MSKPSKLLAFSRLTGIITLTTAYWLGFLVRRAFIRDPQKRFQAALQWSHHWGKQVIKLFGYRMRIHNQKSTRGHLIAANHVSYGDIPALMAAAPTVFVSKAEVTDLPIIAQAARCCGVIFVNRKKDRSMHKTIGQITDCLEKGYNVVVFLESTTTDGQHLRPFRSNFIQAAIDAKSGILPVALKWSTDNPNLSVSDDIAFWGEHAMGPHLIRHLGKNSKWIDLFYGDPIDATAACRKALADQAYQQVAAMLGFDVSRETRTRERLASTQL